MLNDRNFWQRAPENPFLRLSEPHPGLLSPSLCALQSNPGELRLFCIASDSEKVSTQFAVAREAIGASSVTLAPRGA